MCDLRLIFGEEWLLVDIDNKSKDRSANAHRPFARQSQRVKKRHCSLSSCHGDTRLLPFAHDSCTSVVRASSGRVASCCGWRRQVVSLHSALPLSQILYHSLEIKSLMSAWRRVNGCSVWKCTRFNCSVQWSINCGNYNSLRVISDCVELMSFRESF